MLEQKSSAAKVRMALLLAVLASAGSVTALSLISVEQEVAIGKEAQEAMKKKVPAVRDESVARYVASVGKSLAAHAPGAQYPYSFSVADYKELNAFALPGGPVWVHRGALDAAATEAQLAGVMAHEVAHIAQRHVADQVTKATVTNGLLGLLGAVLDRGENSRGEAIAKLGASAAAQVFAMKFSRDDETEADHVGLQIMERAGWDPHGMVEFMTTLRKGAGRSPGFATFLASHPSPANRVEDLQARVEGKSGRRDSEAFQSMKQRLASLPPAKALPRGSE